METSRTNLVTIGYEAADLADFVATLRAAAVTRLIDVRQLAVSRRPGFAKKALTAALCEADIDYVHLAGLGDPKEGRMAARTGDDVRFRKVFAAHMRTEAAQIDLTKAVELVSQSGACLLCYERDHSICHRTIVAQCISDRLSVSIRHIGVRPVRVSYPQQVTGSLFEERT